MTCDVIGIVQYHSFKSKMVAMHFALCQNLKLFLVNLHFKRLTKSIKYKDLSKILML